MKFNPRYEEHRFFPILCYVCKSVDQQSDCVTERFIEQITGWKIMGLPNPCDYSK
jgi:hypothetical protein